MTGEWRPTGWQNWDPCDHPRGARLCGWCLPVEEALRATAAEVASLDEEPKVVPEILALAGRVKGRKRRLVDEVRDGRFDRPHP